MVIDARVDDQRAIDGDVAVVGHQTAFADVLRYLPAMLPQEIAGGRIDRLDDISRVRHVEHPVIGQRGPLLTAAAQGAGPDHAQLTDVVAGDLVQRAVSPAVERAAPHQPVLRRRVLEHLVGDRLKLSVLSARRHGTQQHDESDPDDVPTSIPIHEDSFPAVRVAVQSDLPRRRAASQMPRAPDCSPSRSRSRRTGVRGGSGRSSASPSSAR